MTAPGLRVRVAVALAVALSQSACAPDFTGPARVLGRELPPPRDPLPSRRATYHDGDLARPRRVWHVLVLQDNTTVLHGTDVQRFADGSLEHERAYDHGAPTGRWRAFWPGGRPRMEAEFGTRDERPTRWWHPNGQLSSEGLAADGVKQGPWTTWHANGVVESRGRYVGGRREGEWSFWSEDGALVETVEFRSDVRVRRIAPQVGDDQ